MVLIKKEQLSNLLSTDHPNSTLPKKEYTDNSNLYSGSSVGERSLMDKAPLRLRGRYGFETPEEAVVPSLPNSATHSNPVNEQKEKTEHSSMENTLRLRLNDNSQNEYLKLSVNLPRILKTT